MNQKIVNSLLDAMYNSRELFMQINGSRTLVDPNYMLVADAAGENRELLAAVIIENLHKESGYIKIACKPTPARYQTSIQ